LGQPGFQKDSLNLCFGYSRMYGPTRTQLG
jgi:hypothetical protein